MIALFNQYVSFAKTHPRVIGLFNFIYQDLPQKRNGVAVGGMSPGLNRIPRLKQRVAAFGARFASGGPGGGPGGGGRGPKEEPPGNGSPTRLEFTPGTLVLTENQSIETANHKLVMQGDGNLVLYRKADSKDQWASKTTGKCNVKPCRVVFQKDGNLVMYQANNQYVWDTKTNGAGKLVLRDDAPFIRILGLGGGVLWSKP